MLNNKFKFLCYCNFLKALIFVILIISSCSSPTEPQYGFINLIEPPVITGFYVTTFENPDGTGEVIGNPSYIIKGINIFPNPFEGFYTGVEINRPVDFITFTHLPKNVTIIIIKGRTPKEAINSQNSYLGIPALKGGVLKVRTIEKNEATQFARWDLKDENEKYIPSGYYRAYLFGEEIPENYWLDISVELKEKILTRY